MDHQTDRGGELSVCCRTFVSYGDGVNGEISTVPTDCVEYAALRNKYACTMVSEAERMELIKNGDSCGACEGFGYKVDGGEQAGGSMQYCAKWNNKRARISERGMCASGDPNCDL